MCNTVFEYVIAAILVVTLLVVGVTEFSSVLDALVASLTTGLEVK